MPVIACTDVNTDVGEVIQQGDFGWWCESKNACDFTEIVDIACTTDLKQKGINARKYLEDN